MNQVLTRIEKKLNQKHNRQLNSGIESSRQSFNIFIDLSDDSEAELDEIAYIIDMNIELNKWTHLPLSYVSLDFVQTKRSKETTIIETTVNLIYELYDEVIDEFGELQLIMK